MPMKNWREGEGQDGRIGWRGDGEPQARLLIGTKNLSVKGKAGGSEGKSRQGSLDACSREGPRRGGRLRRW